jgi:rhamnose transport system permease protein
MTAPTAAGTPRQALALGPMARRLARQREYGVLALLVATVAAVAVVNPAFLSGQNVRDMLVQCAPAAIVACGATLVMVTGEIDISVGSLMALLAATLGLLTSANHAGLPPAVGIIGVLAAGTLVGLTNGVLVALLRVPSIIVTLGMLTALRGVTELLMAGEWIRDLPPGIRFLGTGAILGVPVCLWVVVAVAVLTQVLATQTALGRRIYAVGSSPEAARLAGLSARRVKLFVFAYTGFLVAIATLVSVPQLSVIEAGIGKSFELLVVTCVVVGGTSVSGGKGTLAGALLGVLLLGIIRTVLIFLRLGEMSTYWERAIQGAFILLAVLLDHLARRDEAAGGKE